MDTYKQIEERFRESLAGRSIGELAEELRHLAVDQPSAEELARRLGVLPPKKPVGRVLPMKRRRGIKI